MLLAESMGTTCNDVPCGYSCIYFIAQKKACKQKVYRPSAVSFKFENRITSGQPG